MALRSWWLKFPLTPDGLSSRFRRGKKISKTCRRLSKSGFNFLSKTGQQLSYSEGGLESVFREDVGPLRFLGSWWAGDDPEAFGLLDDGHLLGFAGCDPPAPAQEADLSGFLDNSGVMGGEMQIEEFRWRGRPPAGACFSDAFLNGLVGRQPGGAGDVVCVVPVDLGR